jgi:hypothetical protein
VIARMERLTIVAFLCAALCPALVSAQDDSFKKGLQARGDKDWAEMARQMRAAIQMEPQESSRKIRSGLAGVFGGGGVEYLPHYYLGEALKNQQDCAGAVGAWATSLDQKVVQSKTDLFQTIQKGFKECAARGVLLPGEFDTQLKVSRQAYIDASALAKKVIDLGAGHREQWLPLAPQYDEPHRDLEAASVRLNAAMRSRSAGDFAEVRAASERAVAKLKPLEEALNTAIENLASVEQRLKDLAAALDDADTADKAIDGMKVQLSAPMTATRKTARDQITQARAQYTTALKTKNAATVTEATKSVQLAETSFTQILDQLRKLARSTLDQQLSEAVRLADEAFLSVSALMETMNRRAAQSPDKMTAEITTQRDGLQKRIDAQRSRYERVRKQEDLTGLADVTRQTLEAQAALNQLIQAFGPLTLKDRGVHAALEQGARLFLAGDYQKALEALDPSTGVEEVASLQLHVHLFRAASLYGLFVRSGEARQELRTRALQEIARCKQISTSFEPDARFFSPRFILVYRAGTDDAIARSAAASTPR